MDIQAKVERLLKAFLERSTSLDLTNGGAIPAETLTEFLATSGGESLPLLDFVRANNCMPIVNGETFKIPTLGLASRQLQKATAATAPSSVVSLTASKGEIAMTEVIYPIDLEYNILEDAIGKRLSEVGEIGANEYLDKFVGDLAMKAMLTDLQDLIINGDTTSQTNFLKTFDGLVKLVAAGGSTYDPATAETITEHLAGLIQEAPANIKDNRANLTILMNSDDYAELEETYSQRNTTLGDASLTMDNTNRLKYKGILCRECSHLPAQYNFLAANNAVWVGFKRDITIERQRQARKRVLEMTLTARVGHAEIFDFCVLGIRTLA